MAWAQGCPRRLWVLQRESWASGLELLLSASGSKVARLACGLGVAKQSAGRGRHRTQPSLS